MGGERIANKTFALMQPRSLMGPPITSYDKAFCTLKKKKRKKKSRRIITARSNHGRYFWFTLQVRDIQ